MLKHDMAFVHSGFSIYRSYETVVAKELPIVQEITSVLREWGIIWKDLYMVCPVVNSHGPIEFLE